MHTYSALLQAIKRPRWVIQTQKLSHRQAVKENKWCNMTRMFVVFEQTSVFSNTVIIILLLVTLSLNALFLKARIITIG